MQRRHPLAFYKVAKQRDNAPLTSRRLKSRPNDSNISTQHTPTLLAQHLQTPTK